MKRVLALMIALMLAIPSIAFSEDVSIDEIVINDNAVTENLAIEGDPTIDAMGLFGDGVGNIDLGNLLDPGLDAGLVNNAPESPALVPFEQTAAVGDAVFTVTADAGAFPAQARLSVEAVDGDVAQAAVQSIESTAQGTHHLYAISVLDGDENALRPANDPELPLVRVDGLDLGDEARVFVYDRAIDGNYEIEAEGTVQFRFPESAIYDIVDVKQAGEQIDLPADAPQEPSPASDSGEDGDPSDETKGEATAPAPDGAPSPEGEGSGDNVDITLVDGQPEQPVDEGQQPEQPADEGQQPEQPADEGQQPEQPAEEAQQPEQPADEGQQPEQPAKEDQQPEQSSEEEQLEPELELPAGATQEEDAAEPDALSQFEALNDLTYEIDALNVDGDLETTATDAENGEPATEDKRMEALEHFPKGKNGFSLDDGAHIKVSGSARKIVLTKMSASLKNPVTGEALETFSVPLTGSYFKVADDAILIRASGRGLREGDALSLGDCDVYPGNNALKAGSILLILDAGKSIHAFYTAAVTDSTLTLGEEINAYRGIETYKLKASYSKDFGPITYSWGDTEDPNYFTLDKGTLTLTFDVSGDWYEDMYPELIVSELSFETSINKIEVHVASDMDVGISIPILTWTISYEELIGCSQGIRSFIDGKGKGDTIFNYHSKIGFYSDIYFDYWDWELVNRGSGWIKEDPSYGLSKCDMEGEFFMGLEYSYEITLLADVFGIGLPVKNGLSLESEKSYNHEYPGDTDRKYWHECESGECTSGNGCTKVGEISVEATFIAGAITVTIVHSDGYDYDEFEYYDSKTFDDRDLTACPHKGYRLNVTVDNSQGTSTEGAAVSYAPAPKHYEGATSKTAGKDGKAVLYAPAGASIDVTATMTSPHDTSWTISQTQTITKQAKTEELKLTIEIPVKHVYFKNSQSGKAKQMPDDIEFAPFLYENVALPDNIPELSGFQFTGWNTKKDGSGKRYAPGSTVTSRDDVTLWAQWAKAEDSWFVVYNANGGTKAPKTQIVKQGKDATLSKEHAKAGKMIFKGWTTNPKAPKVEYKPGDVLPYDSKKNVVVLYAVWNLSPVPEPIHISFDGNGLAKADLPADVWLEQGSWLQLRPAVAPLGSAYVFRGWSEKRGSKSPEYKAGKTYRFYRDVKLYAIWKKLDMTTLTFKDSLPGSASGIPHPIVIVPTMSSHVRIPSAIPQKSGRQFTGWNTRKDGSGKTYAPGSTFTLKTDRTLWAQWVKAEDSWFVVYDANGGTKAPKTQIVPQGRAARLSKVHPEAGKMIFKGWTTDPKAPKVEYKPGDMLPYDSKKNVVVLYAVWNLSPVPEPVHVSFDANGLAHVELPADVWLERGGWLQLEPAVAPLDSAYVFRGWSVKRGSKDPEFHAGKSYRFDHDVKLYAIWKKQEMTTLTFKDSLPGGASGIPHPIVIVPTMSRNVRIPSAIPQKSGRQFTGWNTQKDGKGRHYAPGSTFTLKADQTLWAQWVKAEDSWFVVYDANGGTKAPKTQIFKRGQAARLSKALPEAGKMVFKGWTTNPKAPKVEYKPGDLMPYDSRKDVVVLYAVWDLSPVPEPVHVSFDANGLAKAELPADVWLERGGWLQLEPAVAPLGSAYVFRGWSERSDSKDPEYHAGKSYRIDRDVKLYAIWEKQGTITLTFKDSMSGDASGIPNPIVIEPTMSRNVRIPSAIPQKGGRQFTGWNTKKDGSGRTYAPGSTFTLKTDRTLWAQWVKAEDSWFVVYDANGGTKAPKTQIFKQGQAARLSKALPQADKMVFRGWTTDPKAPKVEYNPGDVLPYDSRKNVVVLYAVWEKIAPRDYTLLASMSVPGCDDKAFKIEWTKVQGAKGYDVFFARCGRSFKLKQSVSGNTSQLRVSGLDKRTCYKAYVKAWKTVNGKKTYIGDASPEVHAITGGYNSKYCNARSVKLNKSSLTMKAGDSKTLKATVQKVKSNRELLNHTAKVRYYSSNPNVARVNKNGVVTAVAKGKCRIWAIATNGVRTSATVTVK